MYSLQTLVVLLAGAGALGAVAAALGRLSGRLGERMVSYLYYASYGCTALSIALFVMQGLFADRP